MASTARAWAIVAAMVVAILLLVFFSLPPLLDHWDKARTRTRIEVKDMEAMADFLRGQGLPQTGGYTVRIPPNIIKQ